LHYYSNQNQYFLHGLARAGYGNLNEDWLANTTDPTPVFSAGIALGYRLGSWTFQAVQFAAIVVYFLSVWKLIGAVRLLPKTVAGKLLFAGLLTLSHAAILRVASDRVLGADYPWFFQCGLANQYLLGAGLQPSVAGVLLVTALAAYASGRPVLACGLAAAVNVVHATYLLPSAMLVAGMLVGVLRVEGAKKGFLAGGLALLIALPVAFYQMYTFGPTGDYSNFEHARWIIAYERIPHHTRPARWFDAAAGFQMVWMLLGFAALIRTRLQLPLVVALGLATLGTTAVVIYPSTTLTLLFPWRVTSVLIPVATAVLIAQGTLWLESRPNLSAATGLVVLFVCLMGAGAVYYFRLGYREPAAENAVLDYIRQHKQKGDVYLTPARFAKPTSARGVYSLTFAPPTDPTATVYFELARFRLATGAAQYIDFKSIPYRDDEVLEWHHRISQCVTWFGTTDWDAAGTIDEIAREGITHVVAPVALKLKSKRLAVLADAGAYRVYRILP
jgi:hypothetical protein